MDISVVLATCGRPTLLARTLESLRELRTPGLTYEVLVVDNAGTLETEAVVARAAALPIRLLVEPTRGKNRALNRAIVEARGALVACTDDDVVVDRDWLLEIEAGARRWPRHSVFGGRVLPLWPNGNAPTVRHPFMTHAYAIADRPDPEGPYPVGWVFGPNMALRAELFQAGWRFDPTVGPDGTATYMTGGESELFLRLGRAGFEAVYLPRAHVWHQIRPEQLETEWLYGRAFRQGRWYFARAASTNRVRYGTVLLGRLVIGYAQFLVARASGDAATRLDRGIAYWRLRGMVHEGRRRARGSRGDAVSGAGAHVLGGSPDPLGGQGPATQAP